MPSTTMPSTSTATLAGCVLLFVVASQLAAAQNGTTESPLRVVCRQGQPPFNHYDHMVESDADKHCTGLLAELWREIALRANLTYTMHYSTSGAYETTLNISDNRTSKYDVAISFHTVTPARLVHHTYSLTCMQSDDMIVMLPSYKKGTVTLVGSVVRRSVLYIFTIFAVLFGGMGVVIFTFEHFSEDSDMLEEPPWRRPFWALEMGVETLITSSTSTFVSHPVTRLCRSCLAVAGIFMMGILAGAITSQLTAGSVSSSTVSINDVRGANIAVGSVTLKPFLESLRVGAKVTVVPDLELFAEEWFRGKQPNYQGFAAPTAIARDLSDKNIDRAFSKDFVHTAPYLAEGVPELKALPMSFGVPRPVASRINGALQAIRDDGNYSIMIAKYVQDAAPEPPSDIPVEDAAYRAVIICVAVLYGSAVAASAVSFLVTKIRGDPAATNQPDDEPHRERAMSRRPSGVHVHHNVLEHQLVWGKHAFTNTGAMFYVLDALAENCQPVGSQ